MNVTLSLNCVDIHDKSSSSIISAYSMVLISAIVFYTQSRSLPFLEGFVVNKAVKTRHYNMVDNTCILQNDIVIFYYIYNFNQEVLLC